MKSELWPELPYEQWMGTRETPHRWLQIIGKVRLAKSRWVNHSWQSALYVTSRGLTSSVIHGSERSFNIDIDFVDHAVSVQCSDGGSRTIELRSESVAAFHKRFFQAL